MNVKQTGLIVKNPRPTDYVLGVSSPLAYENRIPTGNWKDYLPSVERQYGIGFDTLSCTTFSALNCCEIQANWFIKNNKISAKQLDWLTKNGYIDADGKINFSDRFSAIMSNTTKFGNDFVSVWDCIRRDGLLPEKDLPFGGTNFDEYHDKSKITDSMKKKAKALLTIFSFNYEWVFFDNDPAFSTDAIKASTTALKQAPLHIAIPVPAGHAITLFGFVPEISFSTLDQYEPFINENVGWSMPIHFGLKGVVNLIPDFRFDKDIKQGMKNTDVIRLQERLTREGCYDYAITGYFGPITKLAVIKYQKRMGINPTGTVGPITRRSLNGITLLVDAIAMVESGNKLGLVGDKHLDEMAYGPLQIRQGVCDDVNKLLKTNYQPEDCLYDRELSQKLFFAYMDIYAKGKSDEYKARVWNGGPDGPNEPETVGYWQKVKSYLF